MIEELKNGMGHLPYFPGMDCQCAARSESECGCPGVDWTPSEMKRLRKTAIYEHAGCTASAMGWALKYERLADGFRLGLNQSEAEALLGLGKGQITAWETGRNVPHRWMQDGCLRELKATKKRPK